MLIMSKTTTLLEIFCELSLQSEVIFESMKIADDTYESNSKCEWVNPFALKPSPEILARAYTSYDKKLRLKYTQFQGVFSVLI